MPRIRGKNGHLKVCLKNKITAWEEYVKTLLNTKNKWSETLDGEERVEGPCGIVLEKHAENALCLIATEKAADHSGTTADLLKFMGQDSVKKLTNVANGWLEGLKMPRPSSHPFATFVS